MEENEIMKNNKIVLKYKTFSFHISGMYQCKGFV